MIIYQDSAIGFRDAVDSNNIVTSIESQFISKFGRRVNDAEKRSWNNSLKFMETIVRKSRVPDDCGVLIEYNIPTTSKRVDFIISGQDDNSNSNFVIVELKQWTEAYATQKEDIVASYVGGRVREISHPSYQAFSYKRYICDMNEAVNENNLIPHACSYLHNYIEKDPEPLKSTQYTDILGDTPIFFAGDTNKLESFIRKYVGKGNGLDILYQMENGKIRPSKKFIEYVYEIFEGNDIYTLIDEQKLAYENIIAYATTANKKRTIIINGSPGTGKSIVAMNAFVSLLKKGKNVKFVAPNASFREAMVTMLSNNKKHTKKRLNILFSGSGRFLDALNNEFDALIVDEAHRLKGKGTYGYYGNNQIEDIIKASQVNVFFIDDNQRIRPDDIGTIEAVKGLALKYSSEVVEVKLEAQFRCSGAEGFLNWVDNVLQIRDTANFDGWDEESFEFKIFDSPNALHNKIEEKIAQKYKARMLAGFAWPWTSGKEGNPDAEIFDVNIPEYEFSMPWNSRNNQYSWAIEKDKSNQVGCIHTSQGLEFDYVGVIIGNDLKYDPKNMEIYASRENYYDRSGKKGLKKKPEELTALIKNIYRVLLSRGIKGCYVFCQNKSLQDYFKSRLLNNNNDDVSRN